MRKSFLALALFASVYFVAVRAPCSSEVVPVTVSQPQRNQAKNVIPESCPVTKPPAPPFVPPSPYPKESAPDGFWFGTDKLWINLRRDGTWQSLPHWPNGTFRQKLFWWHEGYDHWRDPRPMLRVTGKRLDSPAPPIQSEVSHGWTNDAEHAFIVNGINLPSLGCWQISGRFEDTELSFVVWVTK